MSEQWENNSGSIPNTASSGEDLAAQRANPLPPDDTAPPGIVAASEPTGHDDDNSHDLGDESYESSSMPADEPEPEHEPQGIAVAVEEDRPIKMDWYILKVQSNREDSIRDGLLRRVQMAGLEKYFADIIVPIETVTEFKGGKKRVIKRKLYPGYLVVRMEINDDTWYLVRETPGIGDFTGSIGRPSPMSPARCREDLVQDRREARRSPAV